MPPRHILRVLATSVVGLLQFLGTSVCAAEVNGQAPNRTPADVVAQALAKVGGRSALERVQSVHLVGRVQALGGFPGRYEQWRQKPNRSWTRWDVRYTSQTRGFDGARGWERHASVREVVGNDLARLARASEFHPLLRLAGVARLTLEGPVPVEGLSAYVLTNTAPDSEREQFFIDADNFLLLQEERDEPYTEGAKRVRVRYADYRAVDGLLLPHTIREERPDIPLAIEVERYELNRAITPGLFDNPMQASARGEPYQLTLATIPHHVYKEADGLMQDNWFRTWGMALPPTESWIFRVVVNERYGRYVRPTRVVASLYSGEKRLETTEYSGDTLATLAQFPVSRYAPQPEIYHFRHQWTALQPLHADRILYTVHGESPQGVPLEQSITIPLSRYQQRTKLIFPVKGKFSIPNAHAYHALFHSYEWSQQFAYDIVPLGPQFEITSGTSDEAEKYYAFRRTEVLAPADGVVVYARNDVPDGRVPSEYLGMADGLYAIGGNLVIIDHGTGESSLFAHMALGTVRVKKGDRVKQGEVIGLVGASGSPQHTHLHYQLQATNSLFAGDGLPSEFENIERAGMLWDLGVPLRTPDVGPAYIAR